MDQETESSFRNGKNHLKMVQLKLRVAERRWRRLSAESSPPAFHLGFTPAARSGKEWKEGREREREKEREKEREGEIADESSWKREGKK